MFRVLSLCFVVSLVNAGDYSTNGATVLDSQTYGGQSLSLSSGGSALTSGQTTASLAPENVLSTAPVMPFGFGTGLSLGTGFSTPGRFSAAVQTRRTFEVRPFSLPSEPAIPQIIEVEPSEQPVHVIFRTASSPVFVQQFHTPGVVGQVESTRSEDQPHRVLHEVLRPVIQEVREVIQPYRRVVQEVRPVLEEVHTVVAKGEHRYKAANHVYRNTAPYASSGAQRLASAYTGYGKASAARGAKAAKSRA